MSAPIDDLQLMAYVDGELDAPARSAVEQALRDDPALAERVAAMQALRRRLQQGLAAELDEPVPDRLTALLAGGGAPSAAPVVDLAAARAQRAAPAPAIASRPGRGGWGGWRAWGGMAASLLAGVLIARGWPAGDEPSFVQSADGRVVAGGEVARALDERLAADGPGPVSVQLSFVDRDGALCRTFAIARGAGLACRDGDAWVLQTLAARERAGDAPPDGTTMRQASTPLPAAVLAAVDARIDGAALDAAAERAARDRGWRR